MSISDDFHTRFAEVFAPLGFRKRARGHFFRKVAPGVQAGLFMPLSHDAESGESGVIPTVGVRHDAVELLLKKHFLDKQSARSTNLTLAAPLYSPEPGARTVWYMGDAAGVERTVDAFLRLYRERGVPFVDRYADPRAVFRTLRADLEWDGGPRAAAGMVLAALCDAPGAGAELAADAVEALRTGGVPRGDRLAVLLRALAEETDLELTAEQDAALREAAPSA
ncbi:hypothetical protein SAMN06297387_12485 [Streptomyces zhaozhouensis]|uniref:DUF4304 domain-containing protein n=1 Tax=Streptomyces zhaozhouensis TaxID=1300267 RepID=A0A286E5H1_9ACTN|nr:hypothetical protein [Streptomyces zhaozhouensis]SOD66157.1 hypothetical protein SAMN06297387_12485 [Streptomyces zhaozhouensis]